MQGVTVFVPIYEAWTSQRNMRAVLSIVNDRQVCDAFSGSHKSLISDLYGSRVYKESSRVPSSSSSIEKSQMYTMALFERTLVVNPMPLLRYAANQDFTAENIVFLMQVHRWRAAFHSALKTNETVTEDARAHLFAMAVNIYIASVNEATAEYPINVEGPIRSALDAVFARAVPEAKSTWKPHANLSNETLYQIVNHHEITVGSWDVAWEKSATWSHDTMIPSPLEPEPLFNPHPGVAPFGKARARIPAEFSVSVFDAAEKSIKYLVLTNTWRSL